MDGLPQRRGGDLWKSGGAAGAYPVCAGGSIINLLYEKSRLFHRAWRYRLRQERGEIKFLLRSIRPGDVVVDIGAHKGAYTYWMARRVGPNGRVFAFEPQPRLAATLNTVAASMKSSGSIVVENAAVSSRSGEGLLSIPDGDDSPCATMEARQEGWGRRTLVRTITLDEYFAARPDAGRIAFIKCDVEGHELEVLRGASLILEEHRPLLLLECEKRHRADESTESVFAYLRSLTYEGFYFGKDGRLIPIPIGRAGESEHEVMGNNFAFLPR